MNKNILFLAMELSIMNQLKLSNELLLTEIPFCLFLLSENLHYFLSRMHFISTRLIFKKMNDCLFTYIFALKY